jgi:hypothetical protein
MPGGFNAPPEVRATWPKPNFVNPETQGAASVVALSLLAVLSMSIVGLRLYTRFFMLRSPGADDYAIIVATVSVTCADIDDGVQSRTQNFSNVLFFKAKCFREADVVTCVSMIDTLSMRHHNRTAGSHESAMGPACLG